MQVVTDDKGEFNLDVELEKLLSRSLLLRQGRVSMVPT